jgi:hypothetical protein
MKYTHFLRILLAGILLMAMAPSAWAQQGDFYLQHFRPGTERYGYEQRGIVQDGLGQMRMASRKGVLTFDGRQWRLVSTPSSALAISYSLLSDRLYVGCRNSFGYIGTDAAGMERYYPISAGQPACGDVLQLVCVNSWVYVLSEQYLFEYSVADKKVTNRWNASEFGLFNIFEHRNELFVASEDGKLYKPFGASLQQATQSLPAKGLPVFACKMSPQQTLLGTTGGQLLRFDGRSAMPFELDDQAYLAEAGLLSAVAASDTLLFIATLRGGLVAVNPVSGKTLRFINYNTGLPDNELQALGMDQDQGVWVSHAYGITRIDHGMPVRAYANYPGLRGNIMAVAKLGNRLYVGTSVGLFYLDEIKDYNEVRRLVKAQQAASAEAGGERLPEAADIGPEEEAAEAVPVPEAEEPKKRGWLGRLFSKKKKKKGEEEAEEAAAAAETPSEEAPKAAAEAPPKPAARAAKPAEPAPAPEATPTPDDLYRLQSSHWVFRQVREIKGRCDQLAVVGKTLLAGSGSGIFEIGPDGSPKALDKRPIRAMHYSARHQRLYAGTYGNALLSFAREGEGWKQEKHLEGLSFGCASMAEDAAGRLWLAGSNSALGLRIGPQGEVEERLPVEVSNPYNDRLRILPQADTLYFVLSSGLYRLEGGALAIDSAKMASVRFRAEQLQQQGGWVWFGENQNWWPMGPSRLSGQALDYLHLLDGVTGIFVLEAQRELWVVTQHSQLYCLPLEPQARPQLPYEAFLHAIHVQNNRFRPESAFRIEQSQGGIQFVFSMPDFIDQDRVEFQYRLTGVDADWTEWRRQAEISYGALPSGRYRLMVRARNSSGRVSELEPLTFYVKPPYWEEPWFYGLEILFFGSLLLLSYRMNRTKMRNKVISRVLTFFTLILIVEFLQVSLEARVTIEKTPVTNFLIQAGIALLIFPIERLLSYFILKDRQKAES